LEEDIGDLITCFKFVDDRFRGLASAEVNFCHFPLTFTAVLQTYACDEANCSVLVEWTANRYSFHMP